MSVERAFQNFVRELADFTQSEAYQALLQLPEFQHTAKLLGENGHKRSRIYIDKHKPEDIVAAAALVYSCSAGYWPGLFDVRAVNSANDIEPATDGVMQILLGLKCSMAKREELALKGEVVIEIANATSLPARVYVDEGVAQFIFFRGEPCGTSYGDRRGKYQGQRGITLPCV